MEAGLRDIILYIGGYLILEEKPWEDVLNKYVRLGFKGVYPPGTTPTTVIEDLKKDVKVLRR